MREHIDQIDRENDPFRPPDIPTEVRCLKCGREYETYLMYWEEKVIGGVMEKLWCCPTEGCEGAGFGFDIFPTDPEYVNEDGESMCIWDDEEQQAEFAGQSGEDEGDIVEQCDDTEWEVVEAPLEDGYEAPPAEAYWIEHIDEDEERWAV